MNSVGGRTLAEGLYNLRSLLYRQGYTVSSSYWQGKKDPPIFLEIIHASMKSKMYSDKKQASKELKALQPWADVHFEERVGGIPLNPPPSHKMWLKDTDNYLSNDKAFSHSYPERLWAPAMNGIKFLTGNLQTAVDLLKNEPDTRQCYIPMWFPEDLTAAQQHERVPCSLGWHFLLRGDELHCSYHMRSCDVIRHLHNDLYLANLLTLWMIKSAELKNVIPGYMHFSSTSLHCFKNDTFSLEKLLNEK